MFAAAEAVAQAPAPSPADPPGPSAITRSGTEAFSLYDIGGVRGLDAGRVVGNYRWNGLPILNQVRAARESTERYDVQAGLRALEAGFVYPGGVIDLTGKDARERALSVAASLTAAPSQYIGADYGNGTLRVNAATDRGDLAVPGPSYRGGFASIAFALQPAQGTTLRADYERQNWRETGEQASVSLEGLAVPPSPAARTLLGQAWGGTSLVDEIASLRLEQRLGADWSLRAGLVRFDERIDDHDFFGRLLPGGRYELSYARDPAQRFVSDTAQVELHGVARGHGLSHRLAFGATSMRYRASLVGASTVALGETSLYAPQAFAPVELPDSGQSMDAQLAQDAGIWISDLVQVSERLALLAALRAGRYRQSGANVVDPADERYLLKSFGASYSMGAAVASRAIAYASYGEAFEQGSTARLGATNAERVLPSFITRQVEAGVRFAPMQRLGVEAAVFRARKGYEYPDAAGTFVQDGVLVQDGVELTATGEIMPRTRIFASALALRTRVHDSLDPAVNGRPAIDVPPGRLKLHLEYAPRSVAGLELHLGIDAYGRRAADAYGQAELPGYGVVSVGAQLARKWEGQALTLHAEIENLANRDYWAGVGGGYLSLGWPRTLQLRAELAFR